MSIYEESQHPSQSVTKGGGTFSSFLNRIPTLEFMQLAVCHSFADERQRYKFIFSKLEVAFTKNDKHPPVPAPQSESARLRVNLWQHLMDRLVANSRQIDQLKRCQFFIVRELHQLDKIVNAKHSVSSGVGKETKK